MKVYILKQDWGNFEAGTKAFNQDGMYLMNNGVTFSVWLEKEFVENNPELFREQTALEFFYYCHQKT